jgi:hypothetical protein
MVIEKPFNGAGPDGKGHNAGPAKIRGIKKRPETGGNKKKLE